MFLGYVEAKQAQQVLDYDDLLLYWAQMVSEPELAAEIGGRFSHVLVDEYQDTNHLQAALLLAMKPEGQGPVSYTHLDVAMPESSIPWITYGNYRVLGRSAALLVACTSSMQALFGLRTLYALCRIGRLSF